MSRNINYYKFNFTKLVKFEELIYLIKKKTKFAPCSTEDMEDKIKVTKYQFLKIIRIAQRSKLKNQD